jgi:hypothetical protein
VKACAAPRVKEFYDFIQYGQRHLLGLRITMWVSIIMTSALVTRRSPGLSTHRNDCFFRKPVYIQRSSMRSSMISIRSHANDGPLKQNETWIVRHLQSLAQIFKTIRNKTQEPSK